MSGLASPKLLLEQLFASILRRDPSLRGGAAAERRGEFGRPGGLPDRAKRRWNPRKDPRAAHRREAKRVAARRRTRGSTRASFGCGTANCRWGPGRGRHSSSCRSRGRWCGARGPRSRGRGSGPCEWIRVRGRALRGCRRRGRSGERASVGGWSTRGPRHSGGAS